MKAYTDIEQSKKLAELLPPETADMEYLVIKENGKSVGKVPFVKENFEEEDSAYNHVYDRINCWSLAALLGLMPEVINIDGINYRQQEFKTKNSYCYCYADERFLVSFHGQPIDAAFEMICWLKENNKI